MVFDLQVNYRFRIFDDGIAISGNITVPIAVAGQAIL